MARKKRSKFKKWMTDISQRGIYSNPYLLEAYVGFANPNQSRLATKIFVTICKEVRYSKGKVKEGYDHISTIIPWTIEDILREIKPIAYFEGKKIDGDRKNYKKKLIELHNNNIFYMWQCGKYMIFIMERDISCFKMYNKYGCVIPNLILKIIDRAHRIISDMIKFHYDSNSYLKRIDIESSFGIFINTMIDKMNPLIAAGLPRWESSQNIYEYLEILRKEVALLEEDDGLAEAPDFMQRLPMSIRYHIMENDEEEKMNQNSKLDLEKELAPSGEAANVAKKPRRRGKAKKKETDGKPCTPKKERFNETLNPFDGARSFSKYYRAYLERLAGGSKIWFDKIEADNRVAVEILDLLRENKTETKEFLDAWLDYFYENKLKGEKCLKVEYTQMSVFRYTFEMYKQNHYIPG